jgi:hypothetical protein
MTLNTLLFRPSQVMRPKQSLDGERKLDSRTRIRREQSLSDSHIQNTSKHSQFLMNGIGLQLSPFAIAVSCCEASWLAQPPLKIQLDVVSRYIGQSAKCKSGLQMLRSAKIGAVSFGCADWRVWVVLQKRIRPLPENQIFSVPDNS